MNYWNFRLVIRDGWYGFYKVYYDEKNVPYSTSPEPSSPEAQSIGEMTTKMELLQEALRQPPLEWNAFTRHNGA